MSTYYYMACEEHKSRTAEIIAVVRTVGQHIDNSDKLLTFLLEHRDCDLRFFSEYDDDRFEYTKEPK